MGGEVEKKREQTLEELLAKASKRAENPLARVQSSSLNMGIPSQTGTTNSVSQAKTEATRRNTTLMKQLALVDSSAQELQAMLRLETASVPGQQVPDTAVMRARQRKKDVDRLNGEELGARDFSVGGTGGKQVLKKHFSPTEEELGLDLSHDRERLGKVGM